MENNQITALSLLYEKNLLTDSNTILIHNYGSNVMSLMCLISSMNDIASRMISTIPVGFSDKIMKEGKIKIKSKYPQNKNEYTKELTRKNSQKSLFY